MSSAIGHPPLWHQMAEATPQLLVGTNGLRLFCGTLTLAIIVLWTSSVWRCFWRRPLEDDLDKAGWWTLAIAVLIFEVRWFLPTLTVLAQARMALAANAAMALALMLAVYSNRRSRRQLNFCRALTVYLAMLAVCIGVSVFAR